MSQVGRADNREGTMLTYAMTDQRSWDGASLDPPATWYHRLPPRCLTALEETLTELRRRPRPLTDVRIHDGPLADCWPDLQPVRDQLETGRGFVILHGLTAERHSPIDLQAAYWLTGQLLGRPFAQNVQGTLLY